MGSTVIRPKLMAVTIRQPWATLIALAVKEYEPRRWFTKFRGPILIHAGAVWDFDQRLMTRTLSNFVYNAKGFDPFPYREDPPLGCYVAMADLTICRPTAAWVDARQNSNWASETSRPAGTRGNWKTSDRSPNRSRPAASRAFS